jgi:hypothetical protein
MDTITTTISRRFSSSGSTCINGVGVRIGRYHQQFELEPELLEAFSVTGRQYRILSASRAPPGDGCQQPKPKAMVGVGSGSFDVGVCFNTEQETSRNGVRARDGAVDLQLVRQREHHERELASLRQHEARAHAFAPLQTHQRAQRYDDASLDHHQPRRECHHVLPLSRQHLAATPAAPPSSVSWTRDTTPYTARTTVRSPRKLDHGLTL